MALSLLAWPWVAALTRRPSSWCPGRWLLLDAVGAAGAPRRRGAGARAGAPRAQHLGDLSRPGRGRGQRRLADRARGYGALSWVGLAGWSLRSRSASGPAGRAGARRDERGPRALPPRRATDGEGGACAQPASTGDLFFTFNRLALQGFGGVLAVAQRELVERKGWLTRQEFVEMLALSQVLPGPNIVNLALMFGDRFFGLRGALAAVGGHARRAVGRSSSP